MRKHINSLSSILLAVCAAIVLDGYKATAQPPTQAIWLPTTNGYLRAKAQPDECFSSIGSNLPFTKPPCWFSTQKVNQSYIWAMTEAGNEVWAGTIANAECLTAGGIFTINFTAPPPYKTDAWVCEFDKSPYAGILPGFIGDFRPPQMFAYNRVSFQLTEVTPKAANQLFGVDPLMLTTVGIHAAATIGNVVLFAGESLLLNGTNFFAFRADTTHQYLGSYTLPDFLGLRQFATLNGNVYTTGIKSGTGTVLKLTGINGSVPQFETVGQFPGQGAYIAAHQGRLFVSTWRVPGVVASLYMSPLVPATGGLTNGNSGGWTKVWDANMYEPDPVIASTYGGGALASYQGDLYWGTMHVPWEATTAALNSYGRPTTDQDWANLVIGTFRSIAIFRGRNLDTSNPDITLLYGNPVLPAHSGSSPGNWPWVPNKMPPAKQNPLYGFAGMNNTYNTYTWSMAVWNNKLWIGTMDWSYVAQQGAKYLYSVGGAPLPSEVSVFFLLQNFGADLYSFSSPLSPATVESNSGVGNFINYGIRNMTATADGNSLFLGMANPSNLLGGPFWQLGGWELIELQKK